MKLQPRWILCFLLLFAGSLARADILFIDTNFSQSEIKAARAAAKARGEKLIVIPDDDIPASALPGMEKIKALEMNYHERLVNSIEGKPMVSKPTDDKLLSDLGDIQAKYGFSLSDIQTKLSQMKGVHITSLVLSGHSEGTLLQGMLLKGDETNDMTDSSLYINAIKQALVDSHQANDLHSVYIWGCYSMTKGHALDWKQWQTDFPGLDSFSMGFGFDTRAPSSETVAGPEVLGSLLTREAQLEKIKDKKQLLETVKQLPGMSAGLGLAAFVNDYYLSADHNSVNCLSDLPGDCLGKVSFLATKMKGSYNKYMPKLPGAANLPSSSDDHSDLRQFYNQLQQSSYCLGHCSDKSHVSKQVQAQIDESGYDETMIPCPTDVIKLIEHDPIFSNFLRYSAQEIKQDDADLAKDPALKKKFDDIFVHPSSDQPRLIDQETTALSNALYGTSGLSTDALNRITSFLGYANRVLVQQTSCIPFSWINDQPKPEPPKCAENGAGS